MNLSQLYYFRKLSELQHYTKAAKELYITQPALSDAIRSLEKELGVPLFQKEGRNVKLTRYGREFSAYVHDALRELDKGIEIMREYTGRLSGNLSVGWLYTITGDYLPALIRAYHDNYGDGVKVEVSQNFSAPYRGTERRHLRCGLRCPKRKRTPVAFRACCSASACCWRS